MKVRALPPEPARAVKRKSNTRVLIALLPNEPTVAPQQPGPQAPFSRCSSTVKSSALIRRRSVVRFNPPGPVRESWRKHRAAGGDFAEQPVVEAAREQPLHALARPE